MRMSFVALFALTLLSGCNATPTRPDPGAPAYVPEVVTEIERISTAVPWPRGIVWRDGKLYVVARGIHRGGGGPRPDVDDRAGTIFEVDPNVWEPVVLGTKAGPAVRENAVVFAEATSPPFRLYNRADPPSADTRTDRPYASLLYDEPSKSFFVLAYSGIDLLGTPSFRKNPTDAVHRYDLRTGKWSAFESHDPDVVPDSALGTVIANEYYPHGDPETTPPPHGLANGPCGAWIVGDYLYVAAKENTALIQYPLAGVRADPNAPPPRGRYIFRRANPADDVFLTLTDGRSLYVEGTSAVAAYHNYLYVGFRTTSQIVRFPLHPNGDVIEPLRAEYLAQFDAFDPAADYNQSSQIIDMQLNPKGELFVVLHAEGTVWKIPTDGSFFLDAREGTSAVPYLNLRELTDHKATRPGNLCFDPDGNMYVCTGNQDTEDGVLRGAIYRVRPLR